MAELLPEYDRFLRNVRRTMKRLGRRSHRDIGLSESEWRRIRMSHSRTQRYPRFDELDKLAEGLGVPLWSLLWDPPENPEDKG